MSCYNNDELLDRYRRLTKDEQAEVSRFLAQRPSLANDTPQAASRPANLIHQATGRLLFAVDSSAGEPLPLHHMRVELWDRDFGPDDLLGAGQTDQNGRFEIWYDPSDAGSHDLPDLELRVLDSNHTYNNHHDVELHYTMVAAFHGPNNVRDPHYSFGDLRVPYWEYDPEAVTPRVHVPSQGTPPQAYPLGRSVTMIQELAAIEVKKRLHFLQNRINRNTPSLDAIQADYPDSLTMIIDRNDPGKSRSDEYFGERILNGMSASILDRDPNNPDRYWLHHHWNSYEQDGEHAMPNVDVWFEIREDKLLPVEILLEFRQQGCTEKASPIVERVTVTPADGDRWLQAKRVARVSAALYAELDVHFCQTHLNVEQYAIAAYRHLRHCPIRFLLHPHLKEVALINREADSWLLGEKGYITRSTAFTADALQERVRQALGSLDWKNWEPRQMVGEQHTYGRAAQLFWQVLHEYVDWFFVEYEEEIKEQWYEVHRFSCELVQHSVPLFICPYLRRHLDSHPGDPTLGGWFDPNERIDLSVNRVVVDGLERAVQPITCSDTWDDESWDNLKQACRYIIFHSTLAHTWSNSKQHDDGGELTYNGLGLRYGDRGVFVPESDHSIAPPPARASEQLWFAWLLSKSAYGFIMANEERDINPNFLKMLRQRAGDFADLDVDIHSIQSRTNI